MNTLVSNLPTLRSGWQETMEDIMVLLRNNLDNMAYAIWDELVREIENVIETLRAEHEPFKARQVRKLLGVYTETMRTKDMSDIYV